MTTSPAELLRAVNSHNYDFKDDDFEDMTTALLPVRLNPPSAAIVRCPRLDRKQHQAEERQSWAAETHRRELGDARLCMTLTRRFLARTLLHWFSTNS